MCQIDVDQSVKMRFNTLNKGTHALNITFDKLSAKGCLKSEKDVWFSYLKGSKPFRLNGLDTSQRRYAIQFIEKKTKFCALNYKRIIDI